MTHNEYRSVTGCHFGLPVFIVPEKLDSVPAKFLVSNLDASTSQTLYNQVQNVVPYLVPALTL